jgi:hypothetical protein
VNLESFQITEAVVHDVPRGGDAEQAPILTDAPIALDGPLRAYFRRKILKSLGLRGLEVVVDPDGDACVRDGVDPMVAFEKDTSLVKVNGFKMTFESGMVLVGRRDDLNNRVKIRPEDAPQPGVDVNDALKRLQGR